MGEILPRFLGGPLGPKWNLLTFGGFGTGNTLWAENLNPTGDRGAKEFLGKGRNNPLVGNGGFFHKKGGEKTPRCVNTTYGGVSKILPAPFW